VVAEEVRTLAQRSARAARSTADLITGSRESADRGVTASGEVAGLHAEITSGVSEVIETLGDLARFSQEHSRATEAAHGALRSLDEQVRGSSGQATQNVESSARLLAAAEDLRGQIDQPRGTAATGRRRGGAAAPPSRNFPL
jgi:methyl-accepting chemotaxis protein